jgi:hypothetical protein
MKWEGQIAHALFTVGSLAVNRKLTCVSFSPEVTNDAHPPNNHFCFFMYFKKQSQQKISNHEQKT